MKPGAFLFIVLMQDAALIVFGWMIGNLRARVRKLEER